MLLGEREPRPGFVAAVRLRGAAVTGLLDLSECDVLYGLALTACSFEEAPRLEAATTRLVDLSGSRFPGLYMGGARVDGPLRLVWCRSSQQILLSQATVTGTADFTGLRVLGEPALLADSLTEERDLLLKDADITGEVLMWSARIGGTLVLNGARVANPMGVTLNGDGLVVDGGFFADTADRPFISHGELRLKDARISRSCTLAGAQLRNDHGIALNADHLHVDGPLALNDRFAADGSVVLTGARLQGQLLLHTSTINNPGGLALDASLARIGGDLNASSLSITGQMRLEEAHIDGSADLTGAQLDHPGGESFSARRLRLQGRLYGSGLTSSGDIVLTDAHIGASVELPLAQLTNSDGNTLTAWGMTVGGTVDCCDGFVSEGPVSFTNATIASTLCFMNATITKDLSLKSVRVGTLKTNGATALRGEVDLRHAQIGILADTPASWPDRIHLDGLTYTHLETAPLQERLVWLRRQTTRFLPQPYEQLAAAYTRQGNDQAARTVLLAKCRHHRSVQSAGLRLWGCLQDWTVGYGYRPIRAAAWMLLLLAISTIAFTSHHPSPAKVSEAPPFNPLLYSLDLLLPVVDFGQQQAFNPLGWQQWLAASLIAAGWILATTIAAALARTLSRR
ncbi:hypothetical protein ACICHK_42970 (plasmid) [Streptomyces sp. AHU1]|uniref:hypothetical protein n=1 Tax=Streptomyces sp. AHU1 TaxID=3377215 RepID=UPI00387796EC